MIRRLVAGLIVVGLAVGVWALWPRGEPNPSPTTTVDAVASTTTTVANLTTTSTTAEGHVVTTVEEAEAVLRQLWFGWFEGIYNQDEERIREVVGTETALDNAVAQFGVMEFAGPPTPEGVSISDIQILRADSDCLAIWAQVASNFRTGSTQVVQVFRRADDSWLLVSLWTFRGDLWEADCESQLEPLP
jgi:hypothetical protein